MSADISAKKEKSNQLQRDWVIVDATGQKETLKLNNYEIMRRVKISARELRILERNSFYPCTIMGRERALPSSYPCTIMAREKAILLNLDYIKMIITAEEVLFPGRVHNHYLERFHQEFILKMSDTETDSDEEDESTFEFRALKLALESICNFLNQETQNLQKDVHPVLKKFASKVTRQDLIWIQLKKREIHLLTARVKKVRAEIKGLMKDDDDLAELYLSRNLAHASSTSAKPILKITSPTIGSNKFSIRRRASFATVNMVDNDVEELQILLEPYFLEIDIVKDELSEMHDCIVNTEVYVNTKLDGVRNKLIKLELIISCADFCLSVFSLVTGILSVNIPHIWNKQTHMFKWVVIVTGTLCAILFVIMMRYASYKKLVGNSDRKGRINSLLRL